MLCPGRSSRPGGGPQPAVAIPALVSHKPLGATLAGPTSASAGCRVSEVHHLGKAGNGNTQWWLVCSLLPWSAGQDARLAAWPWCPGHVAAPSSVGCSALTSWWGRGRGLVFEPPWGLQLLSCPSPSRRITDGPGRTCLTHSVPEREVSET